MALHRVAKLPRRLAARGSQELAARRLRASVSVSPRPDLVTFGFGYGAWTIPDVLDARSNVYLAGVGKDVGFDLSLIARYGCTVHAFDPVPEAIEYARAATAFEPRFVLHEAGLWSADGALRFYDHPEPGFVSRSATNMHGTAGHFEAPVRSVDSVMTELGHDHLDLLKLSVEGSEYEIVRDVLAKQVDVRVLCVEFAQPAPLDRIHETLRELQRSGFTVVAASLPAFFWTITLAGPRC
jgi:FkbM family methyltransferase